MPVERVTLAAISTALGPNLVETMGDMDVAPSDVHHDSRAVTSGSLFVAVPGSTADGHDHAPRAVSQGAVALIVERRLDLDVPQLIANDSRLALGPASAAVHGHPDRAISLVGITGTNGKTSVTFLIEAIAVAAGRTAGLVGTTGARVAGEPHPLERTTPEASDLMRLLARMVDGGVDIAAIEVSSHALDLGRVDGLTFAVAAFTNLSQDHLDFHGDMESYYLAKRSLFVPERARHAVVWIDDAAGRRLAGEIALPMTTVGTSPAAEVRVVDVEVALDKVSFTLLVAGDAVPLTVHQPGRFTVENAAVAAACALHLGIDTDSIREGLAAAKPPPGRMELIGGAGFPVFVDYAHTPEAIATVISVMRSATAGRVIVVVGAGGDRDRSKRPIMGAAAATADIVYITSDNPRSEDPDAIIEEVVSGIGEGHDGVNVEPDRRAAIRRAIADGSPGDVVLVLGKGHEQGQELAGGVVVPFDDRSVVREEIAGAKLSAGAAWDLAGLADAVGGRLVGSPDDEITGVSTDSRSITAGSLFVAIRGETYDGHVYTEEAITAGAKAVLVEASAAVASEPRIEVEDTLTALRDLAAARRTALAMPVVAITGSTGKTSTKDLLAAALPDAYASPRSFNNEIGVPLTILGAPSDAAHLVVEVGSRGAGHIRWLMPAVRPDVAIITNLGLVHLETFGSTDGLADAKFELVESLGAGGVAVLPVEEERLRRPHRGTSMTFGTSPRADVHVDDITLDEGGRPSFTLHTAAGSRDLTLPLPGRHQALNAAAAAAAGLAVGVPLERLCSGMEKAAGSAWRMEIHRGRYTVVNDAYNANPDSVEAALRTVAEMPGRHVAVLGKMAELGPVEKAEHLRIGDLAHDLGFAAVIVVGEDPGIAEGARPIARPVPDADAALAILDEYLRDGDTVLVKASRSVGLERLALRLAEAARA